MGEIQSRRRDADGGAKETQAMVVQLVLPLLLTAGFFRAPTPPRALIYVDPTDGDTYDERFTATQAACEACGVWCVSVWSKGYANMLLNREDVAADEAAEIREMVAPEPGDEAAWSAARMPAGCQVLGALSGSDAGASTSERLLALARAALRARATPRAGGWVV